MFTKKEFFLLLIVISSALLFAGGQADVKEEGVITLTILSTTIMEEPEGILEQQIADAYMAANPGVKIEFMGVPMNNLYSKMTTLATAGQLPDIIANTNEFIATANDMGVITDLNKLLEPEYIDGFNKIAIRESTYNGELQFVPWFIVPMGLFYRIDWIEEAGLEPPQTWDEFIKVAQAMTKDTDGDGKIDRWGFAMVGTNNGSGQGRFVEIFRTFGVEELAYRDGKWVTDLGTPKSVEAFQFFADLKNKYGVVPPGALETGYGEAMTLMANGITGMVVTGPHSIGQMLSKNPSLEGKLGSVPIPEQYSRSSAFNMNGYSISSESRNKEAAVDYLKFLLSDENQIEWTKVTGRLPSRTSAAKSDVVSGPAFAGFLEAIDYAHQTPQAVFYNEIKGILSESYQTLLVYSDSDTNAVVSAAAKKANAIILENK